MVYMDGKFYQDEEARIPVLDHGLLYGDGVFEGIRIYNRKIFKLQEHVERIYESAKGIYLDIGMQPSEMEALLIESVQESDKINGYIRLLVTRGDGPLGIDPFQCPKARVIIIVGDIQLYPKEYYSKGIEVIVSSYRRIPVGCFDLRIKSLNYLNNVLAKMEARRHNCQESVMLDSQGYVAECTGDNVFIIKNSILKTPATYHGVLEGITRNTILELATDCGLIVKETTLTRFDLYTADECFLTGTGAEVIPVVKVDGNMIGDGKPGPRTLQLIHAFWDLTMA